jgi:tetratricopeptide (TPR) repeat protein
LSTLMPGAGHLVHMPSHIYMRVGRYADAADANVQAVAVDRRYIATQKPHGVYPMMYYPHNMLFLCAAASMEGRSAEALGAANELKKAVPLAMAREMPAAEYLMPVRLFALARFGRWPEILAEPPPPKELGYTRGMWLYARGRALVATNRLDEAAAAQRHLTKIAAAMPADRVIGDNTPAATMLRLASETLAGSLAARRGETDEALSHLNEAVRVQDSLPYTEPPPWYYPVRQTLGAVLARAGRWDEAQAVYEEDLKRNPDNGWSLSALAQILRSRGDTERRRRLRVASRVRGSVPMSSRSCRHTERARGSRVFDKPHAAVGTRKFLLPIDGPEVTTLGTHEIRFFPIRAATAACCAPVPRARSAGVRARTGDARRGLRRRRHGADCHARCGSAPGCSRGRHGIPRHVGAAGAAARLQRQGRWDLR